MRLKTFLISILLGPFFVHPLWAGGVTLTVSVNTQAVGQEVGKAILEGKDPFTYVLPNWGVKAGETISTKYDLTQAQVDKLDGTVMVKHADGSPPTALGSFSTVQKGDIIHVFDKSWLVLKDHKGDRIGFRDDTVVIVDEFFIQGPDRQIRLLLEKGTVLLKTSGCDSRQSFFEINSGSVVTAIGDTQSILTYDPIVDSLKVEYLRGKLSVIDKNNEHQFGIQPVFGSANNHVEDVRHPSTASDAGDNQEYIPEGSEYNWKGGVLTDKEPQPMNDVDVVNLKRFFAYQEPVTAGENDVLLNGSD